MSWKFIFNTSHAPIGHYGDRDRAMLFVRGNTYYKFFNWNGSIYDVQGNDTGIKVDDCF